METNWKILNLKRKSENGLVTEVTYVMNFKLGKESIRKIEIIKLDVDENNINFIPFEELTEEIVLSWVRSKISEEKIKEIESHQKSVIEKRLEKRLNNKYKKGLPW